MALKAQVESYKFAEVPHRDTDNIVSWVSRGFKPWPIPSHRKFRDANLRTHRVYSRVDLHHLQPLSWLVERTKKTNNRTMFRTLKNSAAAREAGSSGDRAFEGCRSTVILGIGV